MGRRRWRIRSISKRKDKRIYTAVCRELTMLTSLQLLATCPLVKQTLYSPDMVFVMITNDTIARFMATVYAFPLYNHVTVSSVKQ